MMAHKQLLHELLKADQEPFRLKSYIADKRAQLNNSPPITTLQVKKRNHIAGETSTKRSNACFFSFHNPPDVKKSPIFYLQSPAISPCKSPGGGAFLHVPSKTAAVLVEAAMRIKKPERSKSKNQIQFSLFGSFLRTLKRRSKNKALRNYETKEGEKLQEDIRCSCSYYSHRPEDSDQINGALLEAEFCSSPFRFSLHKSPSSSGRRTPEFCSPVASPFRYVNQGKENLGTAHGEEEKEQCSPISVLDPFVEDDGRQNVDSEEDDYDLNCSYANIERARQQLLNRLRRFEELAALHPMELEEKFLEGSDDEHQRESVESDSDRVSLDTSSLRHTPRKMSADMKRLVSDLIAKEKRKVEFGVIDMMVEMDFKGEVEEVERAIFGVLVDELSDELYYMDERLK